MNYSDRIIEIFKKHKVLRLQPNKLVVAGTELQRHLAQRVLLQTKIKRIF